MILWYFESKQVEQSWWRHDRETFFSAWLFPCGVSPPVIGRFLSQRVSDSELWWFCVVIINKLLNKQLICWLLEATWRPRKVTAKICIEKGGLEAKFQPNLRMFLYWCRNSRQGKYKTVILPSYIGNTYTSVCGLYMETRPLGSIWLQQYYCVVIVHLSTADPYHLFTCWIWPYLPHGLYQGNKRDLIIWRQQCFFWSKFEYYCPRSPSYLFNITYSLGLCPIALWLKNLRTNWAYIQYQCH